METFKSKHCQFEINQPCERAVLLILVCCREFQARVTRQVATACTTKPEPQLEMFAADVPERDRTTLGSLRAHGKNARVAVNRASATSHRGNWN